MKNVYWAIYDIRDHSGLLNSQKKSDLGWGVGVAIFFGVGLGSGLPQILSMYWQGGVQLFPPMSSVCRV
jgi:hypothetical protein